MLHCSFCDKSRKEVDTLIAGSDAYICNECVAACQALVLAQPTGPDPGEPPIGSDRLAEVLRSLQNQLSELSDDLGRIADRAETDATRMEHA